MTLTINTDGGARGNPGPAAIGFVIKHQQKTINEQGSVIEPTTNNVAEYKAVTAALDYLIAHPPQNPLTTPTPLTLNFYLDSNLVVNQLLGKYKVTKPHLQTLVDDINHKLNTLNAKASFTHIPRAQNSRADQLLNQALDQSTPTRFH